jgi:hypothetical protein
VRKLIISLLMVVVVGGAYLGLRSLQRERVSDQARARLHRLVESLPVAEADRPMLHAMADRVHNGAFEAAWDRTGSRRARVRRLREDEYIQTALIEMARLAAAEGRGDLTIVLDRASPP